MSYSSVVAEGSDQPDGGGMGRWLATTGTTVGGALAGAHVGGDQGVMVGAGAGPVAELLFARLTAWRSRHVDRVVRDAAEEVSLTVDELLDRVLVDELRGELAARVLIAAQDAGTEERLRALSRSLAAGAMATEAEGVGVEILYARALADLDSPHVFVLELFGKTWEELGLARDDTFPPDGLAYDQVRQAARLGSALEPVLGVLIRHGLLEEHHGSQGGFSPFSREQPRGPLALTEFGRSLLDRMSVIGQAEDQGGAESQADADSANPGGCLVCGEPATTSAMPSSTHVEVADPEDPSTRRLQALPQMLLCDDHMQSLAAGRLGIGWCVDCERWGQVNTRSPCGSAFQRF
jgi:hypothetical protein